MEKIYTKKSFLITFVFSMLFLGSGFCYAASSETYKTISSVANFASMVPTVTHEAIPTVLANGKLNAKVSATFSRTVKSADLYLEYKLDSDVDVSTVSIKNVGSKTDYYLAIPDGVITEDNEYLEYRIVAEFKFKDGREPYFAYAPVEASSTTFMRTDVISIIEEDINGSDGGEIKVFCGDQSKGDNGYVIVSVPKGAYDGTHTVTVNFLEDISSADYSSTSGQRDTVISEVSVDVDGVSELQQPITIKNLPLQNETKASKFSMQLLDGAEWNDVKADLSVDKKNQTYSFSADALGTYRIVESVMLSKSSYRPSNRIVVKNKIPGSYPGFEFKYLKEGDKVKIYNLKGKKIAELKSGSSDGFVWEGKKGTDNSGDWAESGTYIYQIKLKDGGDVISGTIAFVW